MLDLKPQHSMTISGGAPKHSLTFFAASSGFKPSTFNGKSMPTSLARFKRCCDISVTHTLVAPYAFDPIAASNPIGPEI